MMPAYASLDAAINEITKLRGVLRRASTTQVRSADELGLMKGTALAWFNNHRNVVAPATGDGTIEAIDALYGELLRMGDRHPSRRNCDSLIKEIRARLSAARTTTVTTPTVVSKTGDAPPNFSLLISDTTMQTILTDRWRECGNCIAANAPLAATVMMGGLLEGLLLARVHRETDKSKIFKAKQAPKEKGSGTTLQLKDWTLKNYIDVAHELKWISQPARDLGGILRDYRNYIHPEKQRTYGLSFQPDDVAMFWEVAKGICRQLAKP
jgi:hypothetical protein